LKNEIELAAKNRKPDISDPEMEILVAGAREGISRLWQTLVAQGVV